MIREALVEHLQAEDPNVEIRVTEHGFLDYLDVVVVSCCFDRLLQHERDEMLWASLRSRLPETVLLNINMMLPLSPAEQEGASNGMMRRRKISKVSSPKVT
jgi:hypothetical protein